MSLLAQVNLAWIDVGVVVIYLAVLIGIGAHFSRKQKNLEDYFLAGRSMGWVPVGMSLMAALNSGIDYLAQPFGVFKYGLIFVLGLGSWIFLYPYVAYVTMPFYRRLHIVSVYEYLEQRFNSPVRTLAACIFLLWRLGWMATALYVPSLAIAATTGWPLLTIIVLLGAFVTLYTMLGGIEGIIWTDVIQFCLMLAGVAATIGVCIYYVDGGIAGIWNYAASHGRTRILEPVPDGSLAQQLNFLFTHEYSIIAVLLAPIVGRATTYTCEQSTIQRFQATRSLKDAKQAFLVNAIGDTFWTVGLMFVGMALYAYFKGVLPPGAKEDSLTIHFMRETFPSGLNGLVVAAVLASGLSSIDAAINACTSIIMVDFYKRFFSKPADVTPKRAFPVIGVNDPSAENPPALSSAQMRSLETQAEQKRDVTMSRIFTVIFAAIGIVLAANVGTVGDIIQIGARVIQTFTGPLLGIFLLGMFTTRTNAPGVLVGGIIGTLLAAFIAFGSKIPFINGIDNSLVQYLINIGWLWPPLFGIVGTMFFGYIVSLMTGIKLTENQRELTWRRVMQRPLPNESEIVQTKPA